MYTIDVDRIKVSPVTSKVTVDLMRDVPVEGSDKMRSETLFVAEGDLAVFISEENTRIFGQKKVSTEAKNEEWERLCYVLELAHGMGYRTGSKDTYSLAEKGFRPYALDPNGNPINAS